ncbi:elongation factor P [Raphidocelis subcapitata]|uniref:Elongation factor P n=1 Tax=Raphidocelis subcapitata TaxID=307507 RepID=A0A2V0NQW6_9CHLO|nr:elongation factor P [Raphidocelis subcapitata]|eukprot:GBF87327.1 elongation factor P [Raphidocelis subcapitata]
MLAGTRSVRVTAPATRQAAVLRPSQQLSRRTVVVRAATVSTNDFKNGMTVELDGVPFKVVEFLHVKPGKGAAFVRSKLKNLLTGNTNERTFRAGEQLGLAEVMRRDGQFTYAEGDNYVFMDTESYEETRLPRDDWAKYLKEGTTCTLVFYNGKVISVEPPAFMELLVTETPPGVKGNTASGGGSKPATLETGAIISVPLFIEAGEAIKIDTRSDTYIGRSKE